MPCELLVQVIPRPPWIKGAIASVRDSDVLVDWPWGGRETLPGYIQVEVTDATAAQVRHFLNPIKDDISFEILAQNADGYRIRMSVEPYIAAQFAERGVRQEIRDFIATEFNGSVFDYDSVNIEWATFDIPKPIDLQAAKDLLLDEFRETVDPVRYYFESSAVDTVVSAGGRVTVTKAQALANIVDKLA
jgi:hypothetical protein